MIFIQDNNDLRRYIPNAVIEVKGEKTLFEKISEHIDLAERFVFRFFMDEAYAEGLSIDSPAYVLTSKLVSADAMLRAIPSLDLVLTPNGFGVVNTQTIAPASTQRIETLMASMRKMRDECIDLLLAELRKDEDWLNSNRAEYFGATLLCDLRMANLLPETVNDCRWERFIAAHPTLLEVENSLAEEYVSPELLTRLRKNNLANNLTSSESLVINAIEKQVIDVLRLKPISVKAMFRLVNYIRSNIDIFPEWAASKTAELYSPPVFKNDKNSTGYFF